MADPDRQSAFVATATADTMIRPRWSVGGWVPVGSLLSLDKLVQNEADNYSMRPLKGGLVDESAGEVRTGTPK